MNVGMMACYDQAKGTMMKARETCHTSSFTAVVYGVPTLIDTVPASTNGWSVCLSVRVQN